MRQTMEVDHDDPDLSRLETDQDFLGGYAREIVRAFRKTMWAIRAAIDERDLHCGGVRMEKLKGGRAHQHSMRLNRQMRLIVEIDEGGPRRKLRVICIEDYH